MNANTSRAANQILFIFLAIIFSLMFVGFAWMTIAVIIAGVGTVGTVAVSVVATVAAGATAVAAINGLR